MIEAFEEADAHATAGARLDATRDAARAYREVLHAEGPVTAVRTLDLITFPYPTRYALGGWASSIAPYLLMTNRCHVVVYADWDGRRRVLLMNPSDYERNQEAPFFKRLRQKYGDFLSDVVMATRHGTVEGGLQGLGLSPGDVDYISFDHLHVQDVRNWLVGVDGDAAWFPRARMLVQRDEWEAVGALHPLQRPWYVPGGCDGVPEQRLHVLDGDVSLGPGLSLLATPGHTWGNQSMVVMTDEGVWAVSENGVATESYSPEKSGIAGLASTSAAVGQEVCMNSNTLEGALDQYNSMIKEKSVVDRSQRHPDFVNFLPSSELTPSLLAPGLSPTFTHGRMDFGSTLAFEND